MAVRVIHRNVDLYPTTKTETAAVFSLHDQAAYGQMAYKLKGMTGHNIIEGKGDSLDGWNDIQYLTVENGFFKYPSGSRVGLKEWHAVNIRANDRLYFCLDYKSVGLPDLELSFRLYNSSTSNIEMLFLNTQEQDKALTRESNIIIADYDYDRLYIRPSGVSSGGTGAWYWQNMMLINLTAMFGAGNEPTLEECDEMFPYWFDGTAHVQPSVVRATGKNLLPIDKLVGQDVVKVDTDVIEVSDNHHWSDSPPIPLRELGLKAGETYTFRAYQELITGSEDKYNTIVFYSKENALYSSVIINGVNTNTIGNGYVECTFTVPETAKAMNIRFCRDVGEQHKARYSEIQIELGTTATEYEPYTETTASFPYTLRRLPNGVYDEVTSDGQYVQRTKEYVLNETENWDESYFVTGLGLSNDLCAARIVGYGTNHNIPNEVSGSSIGFDGQNVYLHITSTYNQPTGYYVRVVNGDLYVVVPESALSTLDLTGFIDYISTNNITLIYQLATPIVTDISPQPLIAHEKGHVIVEPKVLLTETYSDGIAVSWPIDEITKLTLIDGETRTDIDPSTATIAPDKMSFTISGAVNGEVYEVVYTHGLDTSVPTIDYRTPIHVHVSKPTYMRIGK